MSPAARINVAHSSADGCTSTKSRRSTSHNCARQRISVAAKASFRHDLVKKTAAMTAGVLISSQIAGQAEAAEKIAEWAASGLLFKDSVEVVALDDPDIDGVRLFISDFKRSLTDKLARDFFTEPSQASISCALTKTPSFDPSRLSSSEGKEVFAESKGINFIKNKTLRIRRAYDSSSNTVVYVAYSTRLSSASDEGGVSTGRYRTSICAVPLSAPAVAAVPAAAPAAATAQ